MDLPHTIISIVDDDASVRVGLTRLLRSFGYECSSFASAEEFMASPRIDESDCVITDLQLTASTGLELVEQLRRLGKPTPVIIITAFPDERSRLKAAALGVECFLEKPFDAATVVECIRRSAGR